MRTKNSNRNLATCKRCGADLMPSERKYCADCYRDPDPYLSTRPSGSGRIPRDPYSRDESAK